MRGYLKRIVIILFLGLCTGQALAVSPPGGVLLIVGDSLSAGYGISADKSWVSLLTSRITEMGYPIVVINKSVTGSTTQNGLDRLPKWLEEVHPNYVLLALGSNDGLRGIPAFLMKKNIEKMIDLCQQEGAKIILVGFMIPPNYGPEYSTEFKKVFSDLAQKYDYPFVPFLLEGVASEPKYVLGDGLHPNEAAQPIILENVWKILAPIFKP